MTTIFRTLPIALTFALILTGLPAASASPAAMPILLARSGITLDQAVSKVRAKTGGRILSAKKVDNAQVVYVIKVLMTTGQVKVFRVNAETGKIR